MSDAETAPPSPGYFAESARPLMSLAFVVPMLVIYEVGVFALGPQAIRNGVDVWLRELLIVLGFGQYFLLPLLTCGCLLAWHHLKEQPWKISPGVLPLMLLESAALGLILLGLAHWQAAMLKAEIAAESGSILPSETVRQMIAYFGAGIYEELLFRLMLIPVLWQAATWFGAPKMAATAIAIVGSSLIFSAAHYDFFTSAGEAFQWYSFLFRCSAGLIFGVLFSFRGFGIAAGTHALYDVFVALA
ncbi:CPBP family intramembrane glutamic endopeptidase [Blastopirellula retiformator]|uniref:CAAX amino terminal protease self-immunity n=1 Tax=Blastopirellula retiformator TaxID=2527970 RepID=A0A5C5VM40_9BACT|nr:CPBP family intramembrane glutamic endopeptidase [Blastopirellula retiformator]TWT39107.1 CAAX amino terminal protease self- immunity [Blastopirellula retiformator]